MKKLACFTLDMEPDADQGDNVEMFATPWMLEAFSRVVEKHGAKITGFLVTRLLEVCPDQIEKAVQALPLEMGVHSHSHRRREACSEREVDAALAAYEKFFGRHPKGYRAPNGLIDAKGLELLADRGFAYDSSVFPSCRFDRFGYRNTHLPVDPFVVRTPAGDILEFPMAVVRRLRLVLSMSHLKLLGFAPYGLLSGAFGLPNILVVDSHPYDFFIRNHLGGFKGWKRLAHARNADNALSLLDKLFTMLAAMGYTFSFLSEALNETDPAETHAVSLEQMARGS